MTGRLPLEPVTDGYVDHPDHPRFDQGGPTGPGATLHAGRGRLCDRCGEKSSRCRVKGDRLYCWNRRENDYDPAWQFRGVSQAGGDGRWGVWQRPAQCPRCRYADSRCRENADRTVFCYHFRQPTDTDLQWTWLKELSGRPGGGFWKPALYQAGRDGLPHRSALLSTTPPATQVALVGRDSPSSRASSWISELFSSSGALEDRTRSEWASSAVNPSLVALNVREHPVGGWLVAGVDPLNGCRRTWYQHKPLWRGFSAEQLKARELPKYLSPKRAPLEPLFLDVSALIRRRIEARNPDVPPDPAQGFWAWVLANPGIPVTITEGAKKAGALLSASHAAISIPGVATCRKDGQLHPWLAALAAGGRSVQLLFDADVLWKFEVRSALAVLGRLLERAKACVRIVELPADPETKGVDDFIARHGAACLDELVDRARSYREWLRVEDPVPEGVEVQFICEHDIKDSLPALDELPEVLLVRSYVGSGKTQALVRAVAEAKRVMVVSHRQSLSRQLGDRLVVSCYLNGSFSAEKLVVCADSLLKVLGTGEAYDLVVFDESEQVLRHLTGKLIAPKIDECLEILLQVVAKAKHLIALDADLGSLSFLKFVRAGKTKLLHNTYQPGGKKFIRHPSRAHLKAQLFECLGRGERIAFASNSKAEVERTANEIVEHFPQLKLRVITQDNSTEPDTADFLDHIDERVSELDVLLYSPTIGTGVSIQSRHFHRIFLCGVPATTLASDLYQQQGRVRNPLLGIVEFFVDERYGQRPPTAQFVGNAYDAAERFTYPDPFRTARRQWFSELYNRVREIEAQGFAFLAPLFEIRVESDGHTVEDAVPLATSAVGAAQERSKLSSAQLNERRILGIGSAENISPATFKYLCGLLEGSGYLPLDRHFEIERYQIGDFYATAVTPALVEQDKKGRLRRAVLAYEVLRSPVAELVERDSAESERYREHRHYYRMQQQALGDLFRAAGLMDERGDWQDVEITSEDLEPFVAAALEHQEALYAALRVNLPVSLKAKPIRFRERNTSVVKANL